MGFFGDLLGFATNAIGAIPGIGDTVKGILGAAGDFSSSWSQREDNEAARAWQSSENQKTRDFNAEQSQLQRDWSEKMWNLQNEYNTPTMQVQRLQQAGINPAAAFSQGVGSSGSSSILPQGQAAHSDNGAVSYPVTSPARAQMEAMSTRGAYIRSLASAAKDMSSVPVNEATVDEINQRIRNLVSEEQYTQLKSVGQDIANNIAALTGHKKVTAEINALIARAALYYSERDLNVSRTAVEDEKWHEQFWNGFYAKMRALLGQKDFEKAELDLKYYEAYLDERNRNLRSSTNLNNASAAHQQALTVLDKDEHAKNVFERSVKGFDDKGNVTNTRNFNALKDAIYQEAISARKRNQISDAQLDEINSQIEKLNKDIEWYEFNAVVGGVTQVLGSIASVRKAGALGDLFESQSAKYYYEMEHPNVDTHTANYKEVSGGKVYNVTKTRTTRK